MRGHHRHPVLEAFVFAAALLLAAFVGRELWRRRPPEPRVEPPAAPVMHEAAIPRQLPLPAAAGIKLTETAVNVVPPIKLTRVNRRRPKTSVPVPK